ncbi:MAG: metalloregulator ArsR/SmtB family transcription factor [Anaerolineae bacterium]|jgi:ArsR family transcriptional regulator|nr:metalloregulator ArsR/SmtB family transcription factor [Anaerolineae bacterium]
MDSATPMTKLDLKNLTREIDQIHGQLCYALREPVRIMMLYLIGEEGRYVNEISDLLQIPQSTASRHLAILRERGLVNTERHGTSIRYTLADERIIVILDEMRKLIQ